MIYLCDAGWSFRDGTSLILSDEIGQIFIIGTGQGESQKDAKYDQVHKLPFKCPAIVCTLGTMQTATILPIDLVNHLMRNGSIGCFNFGWSCIN
jgi:hypothetical protein